MPQPTTDVDPAAPGVGGWPLASTLGLFGLSWFILSWPWLCGAVTIPWDAKAHFYPQLQFLAQSLHRGDSPFWTPHVFSGHPQIADPQSLIFSPYLLPAFVTPNPSFQAADAVVFAMLGLGGAALILVFRDRGWHPAGALVSGLAFAFGASAAWRIQHIGQVMSLSWLPIALWLVSRAVGRGSSLAGLLAGIVAGLMALGRDQVAYLGLWTLFGFVLWSLATAPVRREAVRRSFVPLGLALLGGALVVAVPVTLSVLLSETSNRLAIDRTGAGQGSLHPALLLTGVIPNLFGADGPFVDYWGPPSPRWGPVDLFLARNMGVIYLGALPVVTIVVSAFRGVLWAREIRFFTAAAVIALFYALGRYTPLFPAAFDLVPGLSLFRRPADATFLLGALGAILAGYGVHRALSSLPPVASPAARVAGWGLLLSAFAAGAILAFAKDTVAVAAWPLAKAGLWLAASVVLFSRLPRLAPGSQLGAGAVVMAFLTLDLAANNGPNESTALPPATYEALRQDSRNPLLAALEQRVAQTASPTRLDRVELTGLGFHWPNASLVHGLHNVLGYNPVRSALYSAATGAEDHVALPEQRKFAPLFPSYRSTLADLLGLRFIATGVPVEQIDRNLKPGDLMPLGAFDSGFLYESRWALPRVIFAARAESADFDALLRDGAWPPVDFSQTVLLSAPSPGPAAPELSGEPSAVRIMRYANTEVVIEADAGSPGFVVLNDPYHPWWRATVDGEDAPILRANVLFRAVRVPEGRHTVRFTFRPLLGAWTDLCRQWASAR